MDMLDDKMPRVATASGNHDDSASLKNELLLLKWMMGFVVALQVAIFLEVFTR